MTRTEVLQVRSCSHETSVRRQRLAPRRLSPPHSLEQVLGHAAWMRLPDAVRARFSAEARAVDYVGEFAIVRASLVGRLIAWACQIIGTPMVPRTGCNIPAVVHVGPSGRGVEWCREYRWPGCSPCLVRSTKVISADGTLVEELPGHLCMSLDAYEKSGALHFVSRAYYFAITIPGTQRSFRLVLPQWISPGTTRVQHIDEANGWFRFTMQVMHPLAGEVFYQAGRFRASGG